MTTSARRHGGAVIITGFHRSGTSAAARLLHRAGLDLGSDLIGARASNPFGHFEDAAIVALHNELLAAHGGDWRRDRPEPVPVDAAGLAAMAAVVRPGLWGFKDPRACFFLDSWTEVVPDLRVLGVIRHPAAAIESLRRRELRIERSGPFRSDPDLGVRMWVAANRLLLDRARRRPADTHLVTFARLRSGAPVVEVLKQRWEIDLASTPTGAAVVPSYPAAPPRSLRTRDPAPAEEARSLWSALSALEEEMWTVDHAGV